MIIKLSFRQVSLLGRAMCFCGMHAPAYSNVRQLLAGRYFQPCERCHTSACERDSRAA